MNKKYTKKINDEYSICLNFNFQILDDLKRGNLRFPEIYFELIRNDVNQFIKKEEYIYRKEFLPSHYIYRLYVCYFDEALTLNYSLMNLDENIQKDRCTLRCIIIVSF